MTMTVLTEIAGRSDKPWASQRAAMAIQMNDQFLQGNLSESEYQELMLDLVRMDRLDSEADDVEMKTLLVTAVYGLAQLA